MESTHDAIRDRFQKKRIRPRRASHLSAWPSTPDGRPCSRRVALVAPPAPSPSARVAVSHVRADGRGRRGRSSRFPGLAVAATAPADCAESNQWAPTGATMICRAWPGDEACHFGACVRPWPMPAW